MRNPHCPGRIIASTLLLSIAALCGRAVAQPHTYIIPDIGTPGMNTYVEVVSTVDSVGKFLIADGPAGPTALTVQLVNAIDSQRLRISPAIVSWDGRLLTFQFFVKPRAALGRVPLRIEVSGRLLAVDDFWIVAPTSFGTKTGGGVIGSGGAWGTRSRRGAMIVDSMILNSGSYTFATTDTDPDNNGNQGYLPTVIISRGRIVVNAGATISAGTTDKHAGPGGGGGGGFGPSMVLFPFAIGEADAPQGNGFAGGRSTVPTYQSPGPFGVGTGGGVTSGISINNVSAPAAAGATRFLAGAPGHPMDRDGRQGGGLALPGPMSSQVIYTLYSGGGGNVTAGTGLPGAAPAIVNGQPIGNQMIVPLFGGAGGASGGSYDSTGGGGGGCVALFSYSRAIVNTVDASGANGRNGVNPLGNLARGDASGGGSGGCVVVGASLGLQITNTTVTGGLAGTKHPSATQGSFAGSGSVGRLRHDGRVAGGVNLTTGATHYTGPTMDTLTYADSVTWTVRGTGRYRAGIGGDSIFVFLRGDNTPWNFVNPYRTVVGSDSTWSVRVIFPFDSLAFVYAAQKADTAGGTEFTKIPSLVYSQAAGAVVRLNLVPRLLGPTTRILDTVACPWTVHDTVHIMNRGTGLLIIYPGSGFVGANSGYYSISSPTLPDSVLPGDTAHIVVAFNSGIAPDGDRSVILRLITNDPILGQFDVQYRVIREQLNYSLLPRIIDMGGIQLGATHDTVVVFRNFNSYRNLVFGIDPAPGQTGQATYVRLYPSPTVAVNPYDSLRIGFRITPRDTSASTARFVVRSGPCAVLDTIYFRARGITGVIDSKKSILFASLACGDTAIDSVWIRNVGNGPLFVHFPEIHGQDSLRFTVISPPVDSFPRIVAIGDSFLVRVRVAGGGSGSLIARLVFSNSDSLYRKNPHYVDLLADRDAAVLSVADSIVDIGSVCVGKEESIPINIDNESKRTVVTITRAFMADSTGPVRISYPTTPVTIAPSTTATVVIRVLATRPGTYRDTLFIRTEPCSNVLRLYVRFDAQEALLTSSPDPIDFGDVSISTASRISVVLTNTAPSGGGVVSISGLQLVPSNPALRIVWPTIPPTRNLAPGDTMHAIVEYAPTSENALPPTNLRALLTSPCRDTTAFAITGRGTTSSIGLSRNVLSLAVGPCSPLGPVEDTLSVFNIGTAGVVVSNPVIVPASFALLSPPGGFTVPPGGRQPVRVRFTPVAAGVVNGTLTYATTDPKRPTLSVSLVGVRDTIGLEYSRRRLVFPTILNCQRQIIDTLLLINTGTITDTIWSVNTDPPASFQVVIPPTYRIRAGDTFALPLIFSPSTDGTFRSSLIIAVGSCGRTDTIELVGTRLALAQTLSSLDFGPVSLGASGTATATLTNSNPSAVRVVGARILPASAELSINAGQFPMVIPSGLSAQIGATYAPLIPGPLPTGIRLEVDIDSICATTLVSDVTGEAVEGGISPSKNAVNFGSLLECQSLADTIVVVNIGIQPVTVSSVSIVPSGAADFAITGGTLTAPMTLPPTDSASVIVRFAPVNPPDGPRGASVHFVTDDPVRGEVDVTLNGIRVSHSALLQGSGFGVVGSGTTSRAIYWIVNTGTAPMNVTGIAVAPPFAVTGTIPSIPTTIAPGDSIEVEVEFAPTSVGTFGDSLRLSITGACSDVGLPIQADAIDLTAIVATGTWGNVTALPGGFVRIPLSINDDLASIAVTSVTGTLQFNRSAFYPTGVSTQGSIVPGWSVTSFTRSAGTAAFAITGSSPLSGTGTIAFVEGIVTLGDSITNTLWSTDTIRTDSKRASIVPREGSLVLDGVCVVGGNRLVRVTQEVGIKSVRPNPASDLVEVECYGAESGDATLSLIDPLGRVVATAPAVDLGSTGRVVAVPLGALPSGLYYLELRTGTYVERRPLVVAR